MLNISLNNYPNQSFPVLIGGRRYQLNIKDCDGFMVIDISCDNQLIIQGQRLLSGTPLIPYHYLEQGNFLFISENDELADWHLFGEKQFLYHVSDDELVTIRGGE